MTSVSVKVHSGLVPSDPEQNPVFIVGQVPHLNSLLWQDVKCKLEPRVSEAAWRRGLSVVSASPGESTELWPGAAALGSLPSRRSRHAPPSRCHALAKLVKNNQRNTDESVVLVCTKRDALASVLAAARAAPLYSARTRAAPLGGPAATDRALAIELLLVDGGDGESGDGPSLGTSLSPDELATLQRAADSVRMAARIADTPANIMTVDAFVEEARTVAKQLNVGITIIRGEELKARGMGGIYGVGRAAECPPALVVLSYNCPGATESVAWVGKGIVYDTGGLSIKSRTSMVGMKGDCAGAAAVLAAFSLSAHEQPTINLHAVLCLAENAVGPRATRPDDIHTLYSGRTVEINNTDAEGRLVLSDGVVYASRDLKATTIVDVATLTGAQGTATGKFHAALVSSSARLESLALAAGAAAGDCAHALPFCPELHYAELASQVADMKNSVADRGNAQVSCAALFVLSHLGFEWRGAWLHVDMAAPAHSGERATGYGVGLLSVLFGAHSRSKLLQALAPGEVVAQK